MSHIDQMPQLHTGSFLTKEQAEQFRDAFKNLTVVVRCKDCKHYNIIGCSEGFGWCEKYGTGHTDDWFCADGERRTE